MATPIAFLLFAFFLGFAIMMGAELNAAIEEEWPAPQPHWHQFRTWMHNRKHISPDTDAGAGFVEDPPASQEAHRTPTPQEAQQPAVSPS